jgi:NAD(P)-dependent dehydrogenase (short-subunit alcohol dehydrogenase family)
MDATRHTGAVALVTGAASGIGRATAIRLAAEGATVVATDGNAEGLAKLVADQPSITAVTGDLRDATLIDELATRAEGVGPVTILANVAGVMDHFVPAGEVDDALWDDVMAINLTAPLRLCRRMLAALCERNGSIINVSSAAGLGGSGAGAAYHASKHGLIGLTRHIAFTYGPRGVRCNAICPGGVETGIGATAAPTVPWAYERQLLGIALGERRAQADEIATAISWLASSEASNVNGVVLPVDGGWKAA